MKLRTLLITACLLASLNMAFIAQTPYKISGTVTDAVNGTPIIAAHCTDLLSGAYAITDENGYFVLQIKTDSVRLKITHAAYEAYSINLFSENSKGLKIKLIEKTLGEVSVTGSIPLHRQTLSGKNTIPVKRIQAIPSLMGEPDLLKALAFIPGISVSNKGFSNMYVRGGGRQNNLVLMDDAPMYGTGHVLGFLSPYNTDVLKNIDVYKGGFPARFGGRTASVLDLRIKEADYSKFNGLVDIGILKSRAIFEIPIWKDKSSLLLAGRGTYTNFILAPFHNATYLMPNYYFYDLNGKYTHKLSTKSKLSVNWYSNFDKLSILSSTNNTTENISLNQENHLTSVTYTTQIRSNLILTASANYSRFLTNRSVEIRIQPPVDSLLLSTALNSTKIEDYSLNVKLKYLTNKHTIQFGILPKYYKVLPWIVSPNDFNLLDNPQTDTTDLAPTIGFEFSVFAEDDWKITDNINLNAGLRLNYFVNQKNKYFIPEPRLSFRYEINDAVSMKAGFSSMSQFLQVMESNSSGLTSEVWVLSDSLFKPQKANQFSAGIFGKFKGFELGFEGYIKQSSNLVYYEYMNFETLYDGWRNDVHTNGRGRSMGLEFSVQKQTENLFFAMAYTLSKTMYQFKTANDGKPFAPPFDKLHDFNIFINYKANKTNEFGISWVFNTGTPITLPAGNIAQSGFFGQYYAYSGINGARLPEYHRLDLSWKRTKKTKYGNEKYWIYSLYNAYSRKNPIFISMQPGGKVKKHNLLPIVPGISWGYRF
ncbi:MAG TPA: hypothetical protein DCQ31_00755 [Bacteroidales bacterium]|nr:hypothetical protein [Bacteroidales bacterium]